MKKIVLTSCGIIDDKLKQEFIEKCKSNYIDRIYTIEDEHGFIIKDNCEKYY